MEIYTNKKARRRNPVYLIGRNFFRLYIVVGFVLRIILMCTGPSDKGLGFWDIIRSLIVGVFSDAGMAILLTIPLLVIYLGLNDWKYSRRGGLALEVLLAMLLAYSFWPGSLFHQYGSVVPEIAQAFFGWKLLSFSCRYFLPRIRQAWRRCSLYFAWGLYVFLLLFISAGEYFFWEEFGVRYNFIAVDYLVYTNEVIGNILESYSVAPIIVAVLLLTAGIIMWQSRRERFFSREPYYPRLLMVQTGIYAVLCLCAWGLATLTFRLDSKNQYVVQLEQNGAYDFIYAFRHNKLDYKDFYDLIPQSESTALYQHMSGLGPDGYKMIGATSALPSVRPNIVLITVESLSADFLTRYGNTKHITPNLDRLMTKSLVFDSLIACGNRTVRGLEALSLCIPPTAGESIIKQTSNQMGDLSVGHVLSSMGYHTQFLYGGYSTFDNMKDFFSHNGYEVIDRDHIPSDSITFANVWGVCDGDLFNKALTTFDADSKSGRPFFGHIMTTSNHRPYTYPAGCISYEGKAQSREAAVKYTDYAIGKFIANAAHRPWFENTIFIIIADHCASSAGRTSLPLEDYHIPCLVYAPKLIKPYTYNKVCSQIDVMPTVMSLAGLKARVRFAGRDVFAPDFHPRAFLATYQDLGMLQSNVLTVLTPRRRPRQYAVAARPDHTFSETLLSQPRSELIREAQACYQYVNVTLPRKRTE